MRILPINKINNKQSFGAATVNINAFSDTHGELELANNALEEMRKRKNDIFCKEEAGKVNIIAVGGDWFIDGGKKGYSSNPNKKNALFQLDIFNELMHQIKCIAGKTINIFTTGNHELDGGVKLLDEVLSQIDADVVMTNVDLESSPALKKSMAAGKLVNEKIVTVQDDKNPDLQDKILFLGVIPVNMGAYHKKTNGLCVSDNSSKPQISVTREDYNTTIEECKKRIARFKEENPNGIVVLISHTGVGFSDNIAKESNVDLIFDGHEHKDDIRVVNGTPIIPLSQNFKKIVNSKLKINDEGKLEKIELKSFSPLNNKKKGPLSEFYEALFSEDIKKQYFITTDNETATSLDIKNIRRGNSFLANFVTDSILNQIKKKDPAVNIFGLNSSAIRHSLSLGSETGVSWLDILNVLSGIKEEEGKIMTTELSGLEVVYMVLDNIIFNRTNPDKNPIIHYSGLIIDRSGMLKASDEHKDLKEMVKYVVDASTQQPVIPGKIYKVANVEKYFNKSQNSKIKDLKNKSEYTGDTVQQLFKNSFTESGGKLHAKCDVRIK